VQNRFIASSLVFLLVLMSWVGPTLFEPHDPQKCGILGCSSDLFFPVIFGSAFGVLALVVFLFSTVTLKVSGYSVDKKFAIPVGLLCGGSLSLILWLLLRSGIDLIFIFLVFIAAGFLLCCFITHLFSSPGSRS